MALRTAKHQLEKKSPPRSNFQPWPSFLKCWDRLKGNAASSTWIHTASFKVLNKAPAHLNGSWQTRRRGLQVLSCGHCTPSSSLSRTLEAPLFVDPFSRSHTSSYISRGQMYFQWSHGCLSTFPRGHHISIAKNVTRGQRGILRTKSGLCFYLLETPCFLHMWGPRSFWVRGNETVSGSQEWRPQGTALSICPAGSSLCHWYRTSDSLEFRMSWFRGSQPGAVLSPTPGDSQK